MDYLSSIDLNQFTIFYETANCSSISKTALKLNKTQSAVSKNIKSLEEQLDVQLFKRASNGVQLTREGKALYHYVEKSLSVLNSGTKILEEIKEQQISSITIGILSHLSSANFIKIIEKFNKKYPSVKIFLIDKDSDDMMKLLEKKEIDIMIDTSLVETDDANIKIEKIKELSGGFVGNNKFEELARKRKVLANELSYYPVILPGETTSTRKLIDSNFRRRNTLLTPIVTTNTTLLAQSLIERGVGIGWIVYECVQAEIDEKKLFKINVDVEEVSIPLSIAYQKQNINSVLAELISELKSNM